MRPIDADAYAAEMKKRQDACMEAMELASYDGEQFSPKEHWAGVLAVFAEAKLTLDDMPTLGCWISVKDRKPPAIPGERFREENDPVLLLAGKQRAVYIGWYIGADYRGIDCYISRTSLNAYQHITRKITHWMPLPSTAELDKT